MIAEQLVATTSFSSSVSNPHTPDREANASLGWVLVWNEDQTPPISHEIVYVGEGWEGWGGWEGSQAVNASETKASVIVIAFMYNPFKTLRARSLDVRS